MSMSPEGGLGERASILVTISPAHAQLVTGQKIALTAFTDDRFGVTWGISPSARSISPSSSYNQAAVIFTAPQRPGHYIVTATSMTNPGCSSSVTIAVTDPRVPSARPQRGTPPARLRPPCVPKTFGISMPTLSR